MAKALKVVGKIASVAAVVLAFIPGGQPFAAAASAISAVANAGAQLLAQPAPRDQGIEQVTISVDAPSPYVIGRTLTGGVLVHDAGYGADYKKIPNPNRSLVFVYSDCGPVQQVEALYSDGAQVSVSGYAGGYYGQNMHFQKQSGLRPSAALTSPFGSVPEWTSQHKLSGKAAAMVSLRWDKDQKLFSGGLPQFAAMVRGVKVYSPRHDSTYPGGNGACRAKDESTYIYSENPSDHALTYALGRYENGKRIFGVGKEISSIDVEAFVEWANVCDANGWTVGGVIDEPANKWNNIKLIMEAGGARPTHKGGLLSVSFNAPKVSVATFTEDDLADGQAVIPAGHSFARRLNTVVPRVRSPQHGYVYIPGSAVSVPEYVTADGEEKRQEKQYSLCQSFGQGAQLAGYEIVNSRELTGISLSFKPVMLAYGPGEAIDLDMPNLGLVGQFVINSRRFDPLTATVDVTLTSESPGKHGFALGSTSTPPQVPALTFGEDYDRASSAASGRDAVLAITSLNSWVIDLIIGATNDGTVTLSDHTRIYADREVSVDGGQITGLDLNTLYFIYYDDPSTEGGEVNYMATTVEGDAQTTSSNPQRHFVGYITTPETSTSAATVGFPALPPSVTPRLVPDAQTLGGSLSLVDVLAMFDDVGQDVELLSIDLSTAQSALEQADIDLNSAISNLDQTLTASLTTLEGELIAADSLLDGRIDQNLQGIQDLETFTQSEASRLTSIAISSNKSGLLSNGDFSLGNFDGWSGNLSAVTAVQGSIVNDFEGRSNVACFDLPGRTNLFSGQKIEVPLGASYRLRGQFRTTTATGARAHLGAYYFNEVGSVVGLRYVSTNTLSDADGWVELTGILSGYGDDSIPPDIKFANNTVSMRVVVIIDLEGTGDVGTKMYIEGMSVEDETFAALQSSRIDTLDIVTADNAARITTVETTSGNNSSSITTLQSTTSSQATAISNLETTSGDNTGRISTLEQTSAAEVLRVDNLVVETGDNASAISSIETVNSNQAIAISNIETVNGDQSLSISTLEQTTQDEATRLTVLAVETTTVGVTPNGRFEAGLLNGWYNTQGNAIANGAELPSDSRYYYTAEHDGVEHVLSTADTARRNVYSKLFKIDTARRYKLHSLVKNTGTAARYYTGYRAFDENKVQIGNVVYPGLLNKTLSSADGWFDHVSSEITGESATYSTTQWPVGTKYLLVTAFLNFGNAVTGGESHLGHLFLEDVTAESIVQSQIADLDTVTDDHATRITNVETASGDNASSITTLNQTTSSQATSITNLQTSSGNNTSAITTLNETSSNHSTSINNLSSVSSNHSTSINNLQTASSNNATAITNLTSTSNSHSSSINNLQTVSGNNATSITTLTNTTNANANGINNNTASITNLQGVTNGHAADITTLSGNQSATIGFEVNGGALSLQYIAGGGTTLRASADNILLNGSVKGAHLEDATLTGAKIVSGTLGTETLEEFAVTRTYSATHSQITMNRTPNFEQLLLTVPFTKTLSSSGVRISAMIRPRSGDKISTRFRLKVTRPSGAVSQIDTVEYAAQDASFSYGTTVRLPWNYLRTHLTGHAAGSYTLRLYQVFREGATAGSFFAAGGYVEAMEVKR